ncbi:sulfite exporter TauE/SafE family protein [Methanobacterium aggregans]|uniref:sulfite exporter TauE/SafE family protein n=1 Tax=Methanobacterium aggregans TaxID=1615586 RepID=UPI001AE654C5|nr:sulfite exporter TauE/SafE family protein [Methanobacterium aggregans]MBP2046466.1 putative membrane protein YfcA [Methanobacterium aggregans]
MEFLVYITLLLITGLFVGFASGLLGVGGGFIMVPVQFFLLTSIGIDPTLAIRIAFGTSLAVILPTALSGSLGHSRRGYVMIRPAVFMGIAGFTGAVIGAVISSHAPEDILRFLFGFLAIGAAFWMLTANYSPNEIRTENNEKKVYYYILWGFVAGIASGLLGIGGGILIVPILIILMGFGAHKAIGTSSAVIIFTAVGGIISYSFSGMNTPGLPPYSLGYVNLVQLLALSITSIPMAQLGVRTSHKIPEKELKLIYAALMVYIALKMMGLFEWLNLPI